MSDTSPLYGAVSVLADQMKDLPDGDMEQPYAWRAHGEGARFALLGTYQELRELAVHVRARRLAAGQPLTTMQHALAQYHAGYRDLEAVMLPVTEDDWRKEPAPGEWSLHTVIAHIVGAQRWFHALIRYGLGRHEAGEGPAELPDGEADRTVGAYADLKPLMQSGSLADMRAYYAERHAAALAEFADVPDTAAAAATLWWEKEPLSLEYRLHRFDAHLRQHTIQTEATLVMLGKPPTEARRLLRLVYAGLAEAEGFAIGAASLVADLVADTAAVIRARGTDVAQAVARAHAVVAAAKAGDTTTVRALVAENPKVGGAVGPDGLSAVMTALYAGHSDTAMALAEGLDAEELGVWAAAALGWQEQLAELYADWPGWLNEKAKDGFTPLQLACYFGQPATVTWLLAHEATVDTVSDNGMALQALHAAAAHGSPEMLAALLDAGADVNARQHGGFTPLHSAADHGSLPMAELLMARGADRAATTDDGRTAADIAAAKGQSELAAALAP